jgi:hypothetical protein
VAVGLGACCCCMNCIDELGTGVDAVLLGTVVLAVGVCCACGGCDMLMVVCEAGGGGWNEGNKTTKDIGKSMQA